MTDCETKPVKLKIATTDETLFDVKTHHWNWSGTLYWAVQCLAHKQSSVSQRTVPNFPAHKYQALETSPSKPWNFCNSDNCGYNTDNFQVIFTFNPNSTDPMDYQQFVVDIYCKVTDRPGHGIKDSAGKVFHIDIGKVSKHSKSPLVELWLTHGLTGGVTAGTYRKNALMSRPPGFSWGLLFGILFALVLLFLIAFIIYYLVSKRSRRAHEPAPKSTRIQPTVPLGVQLIG